MRKVLVSVVAALLTVFSVSAWGQAVEGVPAELVEYPDMIVHNGKILTVDDHSLSSSLGTIAEAMGIRDGKILAVGADEEILRLAGPDTRLIDLRGRTVMPGITDVHDHPHDWVMRDENILKDVLGEDIVMRFLYGTPEEQLENFEPTLKEAVSKAKPGQWIQISTFRGAGNEDQRNVSSLIGKAITRSRLDQLAPDNPVIAGESPIVVNTLAMRAYQEVYPELTPLKIYAARRADVQFLETGVGGTGLHRSMRTDVMLKGKVNKLAELYRQMLSWWAGYGVTTFGSSVQAVQIMPAYAYLDRRGEMPIRFGWSYRGPHIQDPLQLNLWASQVGSGSDYLWFIGAHGAPGGDCSSVNPLPGERADRCSFEPGTVGHAILSDYIREGLRIAGMHTGGDRDIDYYLEIIERASREGGFSLEEIRAIGHTFDHSAMAPRPDQLERIKRLGMIVSGSDNRLWTSAPRFVQRYGEQVASWIVPRKNLVNAGIMNTFELDHPLNRTHYNAFHYFEYAILRIGQDGKVYAPELRMDKETQLKVATIWGAYYLLKPDKIGSLEPGKFADFAVLDKGYFETPDDQLHTIRVLMTSVGGKIVHLVEPFAGEIGMEPAGAQARYGVRFLEEE